MSEALPPNPGDVGYRSISGLALGGFIISVAFTALVLISAAVGILKGAPIFYPMGILLIALAGFGLCYAGQNQIRASDGTRAGEGLARYGMGLALFSGLGYAAYSMAVGMAVAQQADTFLTGSPEPDRGFFAHLQRGAQNPGDVNLAFLLTLPISGRAKIAPEDDVRFRLHYDQPTPEAGLGNVSRFQLHPLVRMLVRAGADQSRVESLGVREWSHEKNSYRVARNYRVHTPEAVLDLALTVESTEAEVEGQHRKWFVNFQRTSILDKSLTPLGQAIEELRFQGQMYLERAWLGRLNQGDSNPTLVERDQSDWKRLYPESQENVTGGKMSNREYYRGKFHEAISRGGKGRPFLGIRHDSRNWPVWERDPQGRLWMLHSFGTTLPSPTLTNPMGVAVSQPPATGEGTIKLRSREPIAPERLTSPAPTLDWEIVSIALERVKAATGPR